MALRMRALTADEHSAIHQLAHSRTAPARLVERARMVWHAAQGEGVPALAQRLDLDARTVRMWLTRFQAEGLAGLQDRARSGRPITYSPQTVGEVLATAATPPQQLGLPFASWTLDRLQAFLNEEKGIPIKRSRIDELILAEGLRWRSQETWFGERADPDFVEKRGSSSSFIPLPRQAA
jgi:transposase